MWARKSDAFDLQPLAQKYAQTPGLIWLDSSSGTSRFDRYSYLCIHPVESVRKTARLDDLRSIIKFYAAEPIENGPPFQGGLVGFFDYGIIESNTKHVTHSGKANSCFRIYDTLIAVDHYANLAWIISSGLKKGSGRPCRDTAQARIDAVVQDVCMPLEPVTPAIKLNWHSDTSKKDYLKAANDVLEFIHKGDIYQANLARGFVADIPEHTDPFQIYLSIRKDNPAPFSAYAEFGDRGIACTSPERLFTVNAQGLVESRPIKGTIARSDHPETDRQLGNKLLQSVKDRAENIMIVDLVRNDLSKVCRPHSVDVPEICTLESYAGLHQLTSSVRGRLKDGTDAFDLLSAVFPSGSVTGAPKRRSMEIIHQLERKPRYAFCGSFGYVGFDGTADFNIMIRTIQFHGCQARLDVGSGITSMSEPEEEYSETLLKAQKILHSTMGRVVK